MKMAKATQQDMDAAVRLISIVDSVSDGFFPPSECESEQDAQPLHFDEDNPEHLKVFHRRLMECMRAAPGGLFRVVVGFNTIMQNDVCDPDADHLVLHPRIRQALQAQEEPDGEAPRANQHDCHPSDDGRGREEQHACCPAGHQSACSGCGASTAAKQGDCA